jgi:hypothetical protein
MKTLSILAISLLVLISCQKQVSTRQATAASVSNASVNQISFSVNVKPKLKGFADSADTYLMGDSFYSPVPFTLDTLNVYTISAGVTLNNFRLLIDGQLVDYVVNATEVFYGQYLITFKPFTSITEGNHILKIRANKKAPDGSNMYVQILPGDFKAKDTYGNVIDVTGLPLSKERIFYYSH